MTTRDNPVEDDDLLVRIDRELREALDVDASPALAARVRRRVADSRTGADRWTLAWWASAVAATSLGILIAWPVSSPREEPRPARVGRPQVTAPVPPPSSSLTPALAVGPLEARVPAGTRARGARRPSEVDEPTQVALLRQYLAHVRHAPPEPGVASEEPLPAQRVVVALAPIEIAPVVIGPYMEE